MPPAPTHYLHTGQRFCYDVAGLVIPCSATGQDAEFAPGAAWPKPRFETQGAVAFDRLTGLQWSIDANPAGFPLTWLEALDYVGSLNREGHGGFSDWRLPNRGELRSLISHQTRSPALPVDHPFGNVFLGWYWTSTSAAINQAYAWYVHMEGGRMFFGKKDQSYLVWPLRGLGSPVLPRTGQRACYDAAGNETPPQGQGQDGELRLGVPWPEPRFSFDEHTVRDNLTGLTWTRLADLAGGPLTWREALDVVAGLEAGPWRLPTINELESLVDASRHTPALPQDHPFTNVQDGYWSSTTSSFEPDWCMALYLNKGAVGVGQKSGPHFHLWAVLV